jgi:probable F420-dependent oxidoreductase
VRYWIPFMFEPLEQAVGIARAADELGYEGLALADHVVVPERFASVHPSGETPFNAATPFPDPFTTIAAMATATTRLRFMSYVYILPMRDPFGVAKQVAAAAVLSDYRVVMGTGIGWLAEEFEILGQDFSTRGARTDEALEILTDFWDDGWAEHHGRHYDFERAGMFPVPAGPIPIWVGGKSDAALARAVRHDGWLGMNYPLDEVDRLLGRLAELRREAGDDRADFEVFVIPEAAPSSDLYRRLADAGVTSTMVIPWAMGDPAFASLGAKRDAMARFADTVLAGSAG